jgi:hypothetical protein
MSQAPFISALAGLVAAIVTPQLRAVMMTSLSQQPDSVEFRVKEISSQGATRLFEAEYAAARAVARFGIEFRVPGAGSGDMPVVRAAIIAHSGSDCRPLLQALARLHSGSVAPIAPRRLQRIDITAGILGQSLSHGPGTNVIAGEFSTQPRGDWLVLKLFLDTPDGATTAKIGEPAELFVAINPVQGRGWFLVKDPEYWPELNRVLAAVL